MSIAALGILHPGKMGSTIAASAKAAVPRVLWASAGRSGATAQRAAAVGLEDAGTLADLVGGSAVIVSVCPPHAAEAVAQEVAELGFRGLYADANAIAPSRARAMAGIIQRSGGQFVDGGIVGGPVQRAGTTRLYLSGDGAGQVAACFEGGPLQAIVIEGGIGSASALKMVYAAQTKGTTALLGAILAVARHEGVEQELFQEWGMSHPGLGERALRQLEGAADRAWRWVGEMEEIAATFQEAGLPGGFHLAAADVYRRLEAHADQASPPPASTLVQELLDAGKPAHR